MHVVSHVRVSRVTTFGAFEELVVMCDGVDGLARIIHFSKEIGRAAESEKEEKWKHEVPRSHSAQTGCKSPNTTRLVDIFPKVK